MREDRSTFIGYASHPTLGSESVEGRIGLNRWSLRFEAQGVVIEFLLTRLQIDLGESRAGGIFFSDPEQPDWSVHTFDSRITEGGPLLQIAHTRHQIKELRTHGDLKARLKVTAWCVVGFATLAFVVTLMMGLMVRSLVARVPPKWEQDLGDAQMAQLKQEEIFISDAKLMGKLDRAVKPLLAALPSGPVQYKFYIMEEPLPNAFALPGGHVLVTSGLLADIDRPEQLAGAVAHEIAHVTQKHAFRQIISSYGPYLLFKLFMGRQSGLVGVLGGSSQMLVTKGFSQEYELEADAVGWQYMIAAHIDPRGMIEMLTRLKAEQDRMKGFEIRAFSSHPATEKRIQRLEAKWKKLKNKTGFIDLSSAEAQ